MNRDIAHTLPLETAYSGLFTLEKESRDTGDGAEPPPQLGWAPHPHCAPLGRQSLSAPG